jgi:hypothetical protein
MKSAQRDRIPLSAGGLNNILMYSVYFAMKNLNIFWAVMRTCLASRNVSAVNAMILPCSRYTVHYGTTCCHQFNNIKRSSNKLGEIIKRDFLFLALLYYHYYNYIFLACAHKMLKMKE